MCCVALESTNRRWWPVSSWLCDRSFHRGMGASVLQPTFEDSLIRERNWGGSGSEPPCCSSPFQVSLLKRLEANGHVGCAFEPAEEKAILDMAARNRSRLIYPFSARLLGPACDETGTLCCSLVNFETGEIVAATSKTEAGNHA
jgi:hypothetical protein